MLDSIKICARFQSRAFSLPHLLLTQDLPSRNRYFPDQTFIYRYSVATDATMARDKIQFRIAEAQNYKLIEEAAKRQKDPDEYAKEIILQELGYEVTDALPDSFGEYAVESLDVSGEIRQRNFRRVSQAIYNRFHDEDDSSEVTWEIWNQSVNQVSHEIAEEEGKDPDTYQSTVRANCTADIDEFDGHEDYRKRLGELIKTYDEST